jgi:hypothetical protein
MMVRFQFPRMVLVCTVVSFGTLGVPYSTAGERVRPASMDLVAETPGQVDAGYAEAETGVDSCPTVAECDSVWTVKAGAIFLSRDRADGRPSAKVYTANTAPLLLYDMASATVGTAAGPDIMLTRCLGPCWDVEARYFQVDGWNSSYSVTDRYGERVSAYGRTDTSGITTSLAYSSRLYNFEANLRWKCIEQLPLLIGFRTLGLDERFQIGNTNSITPWAITSTNNALYGAQVGVEPILWDRGGRFQLEGLLKAGIYGNCAHQRTTFPGVGIVDIRTDGVPSYVGEIALTGVYKLNKYWSMRAGYEVMWITNVALAPDQAASMHYSMSPTGTMDDKAIAFYYGVTANVERRF